MAIPDRLIFVWLGSKFPFGNVLSLDSARRQGGPGEILIIADHPSVVRETLRRHGEWPQVRVEEAGGHWFEGLPAVSDLARELYAGSASPAAKSNLLRLASLYRQGGIYLDFDTLTVRGLEPLRSLGFFLGVEPVALPAEFHGWNNPLKWVAAGGRMAFREALARLPSGWKLFRRLEGLYFQAANNAVLGSEPGHPFVERCLRALGEIPPAERYRRFRMGTHLLQEQVRKDGPRDFTVLPSHCFYPLGPEISRHLFRRGTARQVDGILRPDTYVVHWYNSVEQRVLRQDLSPEWIGSHADTALGEMVRRFCDPSLLQGRS
jgi:hypothetical protein